MDALQSLWRRYKRFFLIAAILLMAVSAALRLSTEFYRLVAEPHWKGAVDLRMYHLAVHRWFAGRPVYSLGAASYPPASFVLLWPFTGWLSLEPSRYLWALLAIALLISLIFFIQRECAATDLLDRIFLSLLPLSMYSTAIAIGNGQLILGILPPLLTSLAILKRRKNGVGFDLSVAGMFLITLVKPSISAPFFWLALFLPRRFRPAILICAGYLLLTFFAFLFQQTPAPELLRQMNRETAGVAVGHVTPGYANLHSWLGALGLGKWIFAGSLFLLCVLGWWVYRNRESDLWSLFAVTAIVARFWTYHLQYDDLLLLLPMIALFRMASSEDRSAGVLFAIFWFSSLVPARLLHYPPPWNYLFEAGNSVLWMITLVFFLRTVRQRRLQVSEPVAPLM